MKPKAFLKTFLDMCGMDQDHSALPELTNQTVKVFPESFEAEYCLSRKTSI
ncbi:hypothetical protein [Novosphingobium rosa]|uniref:hypothetical protein n=1 Tax=Novosphingobium rosa TaxID=76978 RepID=UPI000B334E3A|nr:hypothetical protein [Novosphingobium rosa]